MKEPQYQQKVSRIAPNQCIVCEEALTYRLIDGKAVCDACLLRDARNGKVKDYSDG